MTSIFENFESLATDKKERILNAALREFGRFGYKKTSVEQVAKKADIAKGMVFHYFHSKAGLYEYLFQYSCQYINTYFGGLEDSIKDLDYIEKYRYATKIKLQAYTFNPYIFEFFTIIYIHPENLDVSEKTRKLFEETMTMRDLVFSSIKKTSDTACFRDNLAAEKSKQYIAWLIEGYSQNLMIHLDGKNLADMDLAPYWKEIDDILDDLKKIFYKKEKGGF